MPDIKTATLVRKINGWQGDARHYRLSEPLEDYDGNKHNDVIVSAVVALYSGPETYIFPATPDGQVVNYGELDGSFQGGLDHVRALTNAGYEVA